MKKILWAFLIVFGIQSAQADPLTITTSEQTHEFDVELADTPEKSATGLMYRQQMPKDAGMVFIATRNQIYHMWMKNTYIPLDMLFFDKTGRITKIIERVQPHDTTIQSSDIPVAGVLELNGGVVTDFKIRVGDTISFDALTQNNEH